MTQPPCGDSPPAETQMIASLRYRNLFGWLLALTVWVLPLATKADAIIYDEALAADWENWSWNTSLNFSSSSPAHGGTYSLSVKYNSAWAGCYLHTNTAYDTSLYDRLSFWIHGGGGTQRLAVIANGNSANSYQVTAAATTWTQVIIPLSSLGGPATLTDIYWQDVTGGAQPTFYLDDIRLLSSPVPPPQPALSIDVGAQRHAISEDIYGMNYADEALAADLRLPVRRWGGNATTRYNWRTSLTNTASDWYFENLPEGSVNVATLPSGSASDQFVEQNRRTGTKSLLTVPLIGWTAKSTSPRNHPYNCGFKVSTYGAQQATDPWDTNCGNGVRGNGSLITGNAATDTSEAIDPGFVSAWITHLKGRYGDAAHNGVSYYNLDNEPMLWNSTHRDIHPQAVGYDELRDRTYQYASVIKTADPTAKTLGPVLWGWCAYFYSAIDGCGIGNDYRNHGNLAFVPWYLDQMRLHDQQHGLRILDYLDLHYYPQADGVALSNAGGSAIQALRLRSTRSLWDTSYTDESWISDTESGGVKVRLIPRMREWVDSYYPGTKLALTEYNWGGLESLNGALTQADVLGIFGREGLDLATLWSPPTSTQPGAFAFRLFRNYDGLGHGFGDISVQATSQNQATLAVYAAQRGSDQALTILVINKTAGDITSPLSLLGMTLPSTASVYRYSAANLNAIQHLSDQAISGSGFSALYPANSATLFVLAGGGSAQATLTITKTGTGSGQVSANQGSLLWNGNTGTGSYVQGSPVILTATANTGSGFGGWTGCDSSNGTSCTLNMTTSRTVTATFSLNRYRLTANATGTGSGSVISSLGGINYGYPTTTTASALIDHGSALTLTATASNGSSVTWSAAACNTLVGTSSQMTCGINAMNADRTTTATFSAPSCGYRITPTSKSFTRTGGNGSVSLTASSNTCQWTAQSNVSWISLSKTSYTGSASVKYSVARNTTGAARSGTLRIADQIFSVSQSK